MSRHIQHHVDLMLADPTVTRVTKFISPRIVLRTTRRMFKVAKPKAGEADLVVTIGRPNARERLHIAELRRAREPFPVKRLKIERRRTRKA